MWLASRAYLSLVASKIAAYENLREMKPIANACLTVQNKLAWRRCWRGLRALLRAGARRRRQRNTTANIALIVSISACLASHAPRGVSQNPYCWRRGGTMPRASASWPTGDQNRAPSFCAALGALHGVVRILEAEAAARRRLSGAVYGGSWLLGVPISMASWRPMATSRRAYLNMPADEVMLAAS